MFTLSILALIVLTLVLGTYGIKRTLRNINHDARVIDEQSYAYMRLVHYTATCTGGGSLWDMPSLDLRMSAIRAGLATEAQPLANRARVQRALDKAAAQADFAAHSTVRPGPNPFN